MKRLLPVALVVLAGALAGSAHASPTLPLSQQGRWITDADGRVVILNGVNMVYKKPPYHPAAGGFDAEDARFLREQGFNTVRLGIIYAGVEPSPGVYDTAYLEQIRTTARALAREKIFFQLDFHQDLYNERFQGEGWPDWAVLDDGLPSAPQIGFPGNYIVNVGLNRAFVNFWENDPGPGGVGLQDRYAAAWRFVAEQFRAEPYLMGYDVMNEPWPGPIFLTCANTIGCPAFDRDTLTPFSRKVTDHIREVDPANIVWYEPNVIYNNGPPTYHGDVNGPAGMSFHVYCLAEGMTPTPSPLDDAQEIACEPVERLPFENANAHSAETGNALLLSEFGATDDLGQIERLIRNAERFMVSWQYWHYCVCEDPTTSGSGGTQAVVIDATKPPSGTNLKARKLDVLARPHPEAVAGTPGRYRFNPEQRSFELEYSTTRAGGGALDPFSDTEVFVPARHYPDGYRVEVTGAEPLSAPGARILQLRNCPGRSEVSLRLVPGGGLPTADCLAPRRARARKPRIRLAVRPRRVQAGKRVRFRFKAFVRSGKRRVALRGVRIRFAGKKARTKRRGRAVIRTRLNRPGRYRARAVKRGLRRGRATVRVLR